MSDPKPRPATVADLLSKRPLEHTVTVVVDKGAPPLTVRFRGIGRPAYERLLDAHQPTAEQRAEARKQSLKCEWNFDTFPPAVIAACAVEPTFTLDEAIAVWTSDAWGGEELLPLFYAAVAVNTSRWAAGAPTIEETAEL